MNATTKHVLTCLNSKRDKFGNCYFAFVFLHGNGKECRATFSGGESNCRGVLCNWDVPGDWDRSIHFVTQELGIREFNRYTKGWDHAGCLPSEIARFIKAKTEG